MSKYNNTYSNNNKSFSYNTNTQNDNQEFNQSVNRALDQTKDNISKSIAESKSQIPHFNNIVNSYQEQALQTTREISEHFIESQKAIVNSIQSAWRPYQQNFSTTVNSWTSPELIANAYSRFVSNVADNVVSAMRVTNNIVFSNLDSMKSVLQQTKDNSKQIFNQNVNAAKTFEQNTKDIATTAVQDANSRYSADINNSTNRSDDGDNSNTTTTTTSSTQYNKNTNKKI